MASSSVSKPLTSSAESYASLIALPVILIGLIARIIVEEKTLRKTLPDYIEYM